MNGTIGTLTSVSTYRPSQPSRCACPQGHIDAQPANRATSVLARECPSTVQSFHPRVIKAFSEKCRAVRTLPPHRRCRRRYSSSRAGSSSGQSLRVLRAFSPQLSSNALFLAGGIFLSAIYLAAPTHVAASKVQGCLRSTLKMAVGGNTRLGGWPSNCKE